MFEKQPSFSFDVELMIFEIMGVFFLCLNIILQSKVVVQDDCGSLVMSFAFKTDTEAESFICTIVSIKKELQKGYRISYFLKANQNNTEKCHFPITVLSTVITANLSNLD